MLILLETGNLILLTVRYSLFTGSPRDPRAVERRVLMCARLFRVGHAQDGAIALQKSTAAVEAICISKRVTVGTILAVD